MEKLLKAWGTKLGVPDTLLTVMASAWFKASWKGFGEVDPDTMSLMDIIGIMVNNEVISPAQESSLMSLASRLNFDAKKKLVVEAPVADKAVSETEEPDDTMGPAARRLAKLRADHPVEAQPPRMPGPAARTSRLPLPPPDSVPERLPAAVVAESEQGVSDNESLLDRLKAIMASLPINSKYLMFAGVALFAIISLIGLFAILGGNGGGPNSAPTAVPTQAPVVILPTEVAPVLIFPTPTPAPDQSDLLLAQVLNAPSPEISPGITKSLGSAFVLAGLIMVLFVPLFTGADAKARKKVQPFATAGAAIAICLGLFGLPLANMAASNAIATLFVALLLVALWAGLLILAFAYKDWTSMSAALLLTAVTGFLAGNFDLPAGLGRLVDANWLPWYGVTTVGGLIAHLMSLRFIQAAMTLFIYSVGGLAIVLAIMETGKRQGVSGTVILGIGTLVLWGVLSWLLGLGLDALVARQGLEPFTLLVLEVIRPLLAWLASSMLMAGVGSRLGDDASINFGTNAIQLGLKGQMGIPTVADFLFVATAVGVYFTLIVRF